MGNLVLANPYFRNLRVARANVAAERSVSVTGGATDGALSLFSKKLGAINIQDIGWLTALYGELKVSVAGQVGKLHACLYEQDYPVGTLETSNPDGLTGYITGVSVNRTVATYAFVRNSNIASNSSTSTPPIPVYFVAWLYANETGTSFIASCRNVKACGWVNSFF